MELCPKCQMKGYESITLNNNHKQTFLIKPCDCKHGTQIKWYFKMHGDSFKAPVMNKMKRRGYKSLTKKQYINMRKLVLKRLIEKIGDDRGKYF